MSKSLADAVTTARQFTTQKEKFAALSGLGTVEQKLLHETFNPYRVFGVRQFDMPTTFAASDFNYDPFLNLLDHLATRALTGNAAKEAVTRTLRLYTQRTAEILVQVILKDLNCGANRDTFEKLYPNLGIPQFDLMLCGKIEHAKNAQGEITYPKYRWTFPCLGEVKYDGMRLIAVVDHGVVEYLSRSGKPADQWAGLFDDELIAMEKHVGAPIAVDGEALAEGFQATAKAKGSKNDKSGMKFIVFDFMPLTDWRQQLGRALQGHRTQQLETMIKDLGLTKVVKSTGKILNNLAEARAFYTEVIELGLPGQDEGLIIKQLNGRYEWNGKKRSLTWAKWKPVIDVDVKIVGCYEGEGKNVGRLGGFLVEGEDENGNKVKSRCGGFKVNSAKFKAWIARFAKVNHIPLDKIYESGVSKDEFFRTYAWRHQYLFIDQVAMIETQELSKAEGSDTFALRFPQFISLRIDK